MLLLCQSSSVWGNNEEGRFFLSLGGGQITPRLAFSGHGKKSSGFIAPAKLDKTLCFGEFWIIEKTGKRKNNAGAAFSKPPAILSYG
jgi:hypothetical protein